MAFSASVVSISYVILPQKKISLVWHNLFLTVFDDCCSPLSFPSLSLFFFFLFNIFSDVGKISGYFNIFFSQLTPQVCTKLFHNFFSFLNQVDVIVFWYLFFLLLFLEIPDDVPYLRAQNGETHNDYIIRSL